MYAYVVVFRGHDGEWHSVAVTNAWDDAFTAFRAMVYTLTATDYYEDCSPDVAKIIDGRGGAGSAFYAQAAALDSAIS